MPATLITAFEVPPDADEPFIAGARDFLAAREGFAASALYRALRDDVDFRFVNVARLDSPQEGIADPDFPAAGASRPIRACTRSCTRTGTWTARAASC